MKRLLAIAMALAAYGFAQLASAVGTVAGTDIDNTAQVSYEVGGSPVTENSNTLTVTVAEILDIIDRNARYTTGIIERIQEPLREVEMQDVDVNAVLNDIVGRVAETRQPDITQEIEIS